MKIRFSLLEKFLIRILISIQKKFWGYTKLKFNRINPLIEDITDWKRKGEYLFGAKNITVYDSSTIAGEVKVGENTWIGPYTALDGTGGLTIGKNCSISSGVNIVSHDTIKWALSGGKEEYEYSPITIGDNCFIGTKAFINKGVKIGDRCLIAAGSVVTNSFPDNSIIGGIPAKKIGEVSLKDDGTIEFSYFSKR